MRTDYVPGRGRAVVAGDTVAMLPDGCLPELLEALWVSLRSGADVTDHLQVLLAGGLAQAPAFALVRLEGGVAHVVARGSARVEVGTEHGVVTVAAGRVSTWTEQLVPDVVDVTIVGVGPVDGPTLPIVAGVVPADRLLVGALTQAGAVAPPTAGAAAAVHPIRAGVPGMTAAGGAHDEHTGLPPRPGPHTAGQGIPVVAPGVEVAMAAALEADRLAAPLTAPLPPPLVAPGVPVVPALTPPAPAAVGPVAEPTAHVHTPVTGDPLRRPVWETAGAFRRWPDQPERPDVPGTQEGAGEVGDGDLEENRHAPTLENPVVPARLHADPEPPSESESQHQPAIVVPELEDDDEPFIGGVPVWEPILSPLPGASSPSQPVSPWARAGEPPATSGPVPAPQPASVAVPAGLPSAAPSAVPSPVPAVAGVPRGLPEDHDGLTVLSSDVVALRRQLPDWAGDAVPQLAVPTPRTPAPAKLLMSTGLVVSLNRPVLIGRAPQVTRVTGAEIPRLVTVASPNQDISRTHAEVRMDGEDVVVTDLRSTNGVLLLRQGQGAQRLHPGEPTVVEPGVVVDLGEGVTFLVEAGG